MYLERISASRWPEGKFGLFGTFLINNSCEKVQSSVGGDTIGQIVVGYIKKQAEKALESKPIPSTPPWSQDLIPPSRFLP